jgi:ABC-type transporter Mla MlaB component
MLRLTHQSRTPEEEVVKVEGWLTREEVDLLAQVGRQVRQRGARLVLELEGVRSIDEKGLALLASWAGPQLVLRRPSLFVGQLLQRHGLAWEEGPEGEP